MRWRIVLIFLAGTASAACTSLLGDFEVGASPAVDAGARSEAAGPADAASTDATNVDSSPPMVTAVVSDVAVYLGQPASLDASKSATTGGSLAFQWKLKSAPTGSRLTDRDLTGATSPIVTFLPDVVGAYSLTVTLRALGGMATANPNVTAVVPQVLFAQGGSNVGGNGAGGAGSTEYTITDIDGGNPHAVLCPNPATNGSNFVALAPFAAYGGRAYDYWEAPAGQPSRFAAFSVDFNADAGGFSTHLWTGSSLSTCANAPTDLGNTEFGVGRPFGSEPRFNSDGTRFVVFDRQWRIVTFGTGSATSDQPNIVATYQVPYPQAPSFLDPVGLEPNTGYVFEPPRVTWTATGLAWAQPTSDGWEIVTAPDMPSAPTMTYMTCPGITPREIAMLADGTVIASYRLTALSSENLYRLKPDAQQNCSHEMQYTNLSDAGSSTATDFAISPDGSQIAFVQIDLSVQDGSPWLRSGSQWPGGYVYVVPVAGGMPHQVSTDPALFGPRWIGGGTSLVFTRIDGFGAVTGYPATSVVVISPDGGGKQIIAQGDGVSTFVSTSGNAACAIVGAPRTRSGSSAARWLAGLMALAFCARRRVRRS